MNWFGSSIRAFAAALVGTALGVLLYVKLFAIGWELPWVVGLLTGLFCAAASSDRSLMRGLLVGSVAVWVAASAQVLSRPEESGSGLLIGLARFHESLTFHRFILHAAGALLAVTLGTASLRPRARSASALGAPASRRT